MRLFKLLIFMLLAYSCSSEEGGQSTSEIKSNTERHREMLNEIDSLETLVYDSSYSVNTSEAARLMQDYLKFAKLFPGDKEKSPEFLYKAAALSRAVNLPVKAIKLYDQILLDYPSWEKAPEVAFLIAFTYDEDLSEVERAKEAYVKVTEKYPGDHWALQAEQRLETIDMSNEELLEFLKKNAQETAS